MSDITQPKNDLINYDILLGNCLKPLVGASPHLLMNRAVLVLSLTTGFPVEYMKWFKWKDIVNLGSENDVIVKDKLVGRSYIIPIHPKVKVLLSQIYSLLLFPPLDSLIVDLNRYPEFARKPGFNFSEMVIRGGSNKSEAYKRVYNEYFEKLNTDTYTQVLFGRKVLEVNGYTNEVSKRLKKHFNLKLNSELFKFLQYGSINEIEFELSSINLIDKGGVKFDGNTEILQYTKEFIRLEDKNFNDVNNDFPIQRFSAFSKFLISGNTFYHKPVTNSIRILLLISLFNGIRPSLLLTLKWKHIVKINKDEKTFEIVDSCILGDHTIKFGTEVISKILYHLQLSMSRATKTELPYFNTTQIQHKIEPDLNTAIFVTNMDNPLTQPSLLREIKKALEYWKFPHTNKFSTKSTVIMWARRIIEIKGDHKPTIQKLKEHFNFKSKKELFDFLFISYNKKTDNYEFKGKLRDIFDSILYDLYD